MVGLRGPEGYPVQEPLSMLCGHCAANPIILMLSMNVGPKEMNIAIMLYLGLIKYNNTVICKYEESVKAYSLGGEIKEGNTEFS